VGRLETAAVEQTGLPDEVASSIVAVKRCVAADGTLLVDRALEAAEPSAAEAFAALVMVAVSAADLAEAASGEAWAAVVSAVVVSAGAAGSEAAGAALISR
jgi:hypothetical protein